MAGPPRPPSAACRQCSGPILDRRATKYCSPECRQRGGPAFDFARRAKRKGAVADLVDHTTVFERDGWHCYLCGEETPADLRNSYSPRAPTADHVVPLNRGGAHTYENIRCACRRCNSAKGDRLREEFQVPEGVAAKLAPKRPGGRTPRPAREAGLVKIAAALVGAEMGLVAADPIARVIARRVRDELVAFISEGDEPLLKTLSELLPEPTPFRTLAADPDVDTLSLYVEARVTRVRNRLGRSLTPDQDRIENREITDKVEAQLVGRYIRIIRR